METDIIELCDLADKLNSKAYADICEQDLSDVDFAQALLAIVNEYTLKIMKGEGNGLGK